MSKHMGRVFFGLLFLLGIMDIYSQEIKAIRDETPETLASRYRQLGSYDPILWPLSKGGQICKLNYASDSNAQTLAIDFEFVGHGGIEYLEFGTPYLVRNSGLYLGIRAKIESTTGETLPCSFNPRLVDRSGETHQFSLDTRVGQWLIGKIPNSGLHWGGDNDGKLQFPCFLSTITMDRLRDGWKMKGKLTVYEVAFFEQRDMEKMKMIQADLPDLKKGNNLLEATGKNETVTIKISPAGAYAQEQKNMPENTKSKMKGELTIQLLRQTNGIHHAPKTLSNLKEAFQIPKLTKPGFESVLFVPSFKKENGQIEYGHPLKYSFAVLPKVEKLNKWLMVSTHVNFPCVDRLAKAGVGMLRDDIIWSHVEHEKGKYVFPDRWDKYVDRARELGIEPLLIILYANPLYDNGDYPHTDEAITAYARYAAEVVRHFKGRCRYYEIWNEWTGGCGMGDKTKLGHNTPENYLKLIKAASQAIRQVDPDAYLIGGGGDHYTAHFSQIEAMMKLGVMKYCDAFSVHPYIYPKTPNEEGMKEKMEKVVQAMRTSGQCEHPKLWLTELGWPTYLGLHKNREHKTNSFFLEDFSASMLAQSCIIYKSIPEIEKYVWYDLHNDGTDLFYNENNFGLLHNASYGYQPKASFVALATISRLLNDATVTESKELSSVTRKVYRIEKTDGSVILAAWTHQETETMTISNVAKVVGLYGNELPVETRAISTRPVYFHLKENK